MTDLTDTTIAAAFGHLATIDGDTALVGDATTAATIFADDTDDDILRTVVEGLRLASRVGIGWDGDSTGHHLGTDGSWSDPALYLEADTVKIDGDVLRVAAAAWAADWDGEDFRNERSGRTVTLEIPFIREAE